MANQTWTTGQKVSGNYLGDVKFTGKLGDRCRPTPDYRNTIFDIILDAEIWIFGRRTDRLEIWSNDKYSQIYF